MTSRPGASARRSGPSGLARRPAAALAILVLGLLLALAPPVAAQEPQEPTARRMFDRSRPGVHLVVAEFTGQVTIPYLEFDTAAVDQAVRRLARERGVTDPAQSLALAVEVVHQDPLAYFVPLATVQTVPVSVVGTGSGFAISPDGHVVTNAHVVAPDEAELRANIASQGLAEFNAEIAATLGEQFRARGLVLSETQSRQLVEAVQAYVANYTQLGEVTTRIAIAPQSGVLPAGQEPPAAQLTIAGESIPGDDVAVIKVDGASNMPTMPLGDDTALGTGDSLFVIGYPAAATFNPLFDEESITEPTLTSGVLSAKKALQSGTTVLQTDASMTQGNSGGPVVDAEGNVVGVATFTAVDPETGQQVAGVNFVMPVSLVKEFLGRAGVQPAESVTTQRYNAALDAYEQQQYSRALPLFQEVRQLYPDHPEIERLIADTQAAIAEGGDETPGAGILGFLPPLTSFAGVLLILLGLVALILPVVLVVVFRARQAASQAHGAYPVAQSTYPAAQSEYPVAQSTYPDAQSTYPDAQSTYPVAQSTYPDAQGGYAPGPYAAAPDPYAAAPAQYADPAGAYAQQSGTYAPNGPYAQPDGTYVEPTGTYMAPAETSADPHGTYLQPTGTYMAPAAPVPPVPPAPAPNVEPTGTYMAQPAPARTCGRCGGALRATAKFCPTCGTKVPR